MSSNESAIWFSLANEICDFTKIIKKAKKQNKQKKHNLELNK